MIDYDGRPGHPPAWNNVRRRTLTSRVARPEKRKVDGSIPSLPTHLNSGNTVRL
jgi:hypothetical protein